MNYQILYKSANFPKFPKSSPWNPQITPISDSPCCLPIWLPAFTAFFQLQVSGEAFQVQDLA